MRIKIEEICQLMEQFEKSSLQEMEWVGRGNRLVFRKKREEAAGPQTPNVFVQTEVPAAAAVPVQVSADSKAAAGAGAQTVPVSEAVPAEAEKEEAADKPEQKKAAEVTAPLAGVFYRASKPGEKPYVEVGQTVKKGDTVGLMEAMKMMSEIPAPCDGRVLSIELGDGEFAEFGRVLLTIEESADV